MALAPGEAQVLAAVLKVLGDPIRLQLFCLIAAAPDREAGVGTLVDQFSLTPPTISHHLKQLHSVGLLEREKRGLRVYYRADPLRLDAILATLGSSAR